MELHDSDIGPYLKHLQINGTRAATVPAGKKRKFDLNYIVVPKNKLGSIKPKNRITFAGGRGDAYKLRNMTLYVQLRDGSWVKSETDGRICSSQNRRNGVNSEGIVMNPIEVDIRF